jgi:Phage XkdN-like protein.
MSLIDKLLQADAGKLTEKPHEVYEVKRLSMALATKFELELRAVGAQRCAEIKRLGIDIGKKGTVRGVNIYEMQIATLLEGIKEPDLKNKDLLAHFKAVTPKELIAKLFLPGEIEDIYNRINVLSGYEEDDDDANEEIKN